MILRTLVVGDLGTNCYLIACERTLEALVVDPGGDAEDILAAVDELGLRVLSVVLTHFHFDHILAAPEVCQRTGAPLAIHEAGARLLSEPPALFRFFSPHVHQGLRADRLLRDGDVLEVGDLRVQVLHTPGHSPDGISLWAPDEGVVLCGDLLFNEGVGRTDFPGSDAAALVRAVRERLFALSDETEVYPGHGPKTTIGHERVHNPWVSDRAFRG